MVGMALALANAGCGGPLEEDVEVEGDVEEVGEVVSPLSTTQQSAMGDCTFTKTLNKVKLSTGKLVMRGKCTLKCDEDASKAGIYSMYVVKPDGSASAFKENLGPTEGGTSRSTTAQVKYVPGFYSTSCTGVWQRKSGEKSWYMSGQFLGARF